jgi:FMN phosphatase YigB (HAD superfamily)
MIEALNHLAAKNMKRTLATLSILALMSGPSYAETSGLALRIKCTTIVDATNGDLPITASVKHYINGLFDGIAISNGVTIPGPLPETYRLLLSACRSNPNAFIHSVIADTFAD